MAGSKPNVDVCIEDGMSRLGMFIGEPVWDKRDDVKNDNSGVRTISIALSAEALS